MQKPVNFKKRLIATAIASLAGMSGVVFAEQSADAVEEVVVTGIRASIQKSIDLKRDASGVVDAISAEDIGKFPDTNLAESLQRITGVSIDRSGGEGSKITVRGLGAEFNLVTLNGRQLARTTGDRTFDFANMASELVSSISVAKTSNAALYSGGMGATVNITTPRPLDHPGQKVVLSGKAISDDSGNGDLTPELFGLYSNTFVDDTIGVSVAIGHQERNSGTKEFETGTAWRVHPASENAGGWGQGPGSIPEEGQVNRVSPTSQDNYNRPQVAQYIFTDSERERTNGNLVLQWAPNESVKATVDIDTYTRTVETRKHDVSAWFNFEPVSAAWTNGPASGPTVFSEYYANPADMSQISALKNEKEDGKSIGFNVDWTLSDRLSANADIFSSHATLKPNTPWGGDLSQSTAAFIRTSASVDYSGEVPAIIVGGTPFTVTRKIKEGLDKSVDPMGKPWDATKDTSYDYTKTINADKPATGNSVAPDDMYLTGGNYINHNNVSDVNSIKLAGKFEKDEHVTYDFGVSTIAVRNKKQELNVQRGDWGGLGNPSIIDQYNAQQLGKKAVGNTIAAIATGTEHGAASQFSGSMGSFADAEQIAKLTSVVLIQNPDPSIANADLAKKLVGTPLKDVNGKIVTRPILGPGSANIYVEYGPNAGTVKPNALGNTVVPPPSADKLSQRDGVALRAGNIQDKMYYMNFEDLRAFAEKNYNTPDRIAAAPFAGNCNGIVSIYCASSDYSKGTDNSVEESTDAAYVQRGYKGEVDEMKYNFNVGLRYERTLVEAKTASQTYNGAIWKGETEIPLTSSGIQYLTNRNSYSYFLPNIDFSLNPTDDVTLRISQSKTIGRPAYFDLSAGTSLNSGADRTGGRGDSGNTKLSPLQSTNFDLSAEWYYSEQSYVSLGYFNKAIEKVISTVPVKVNLWGIRNPGTGPREQAAEKAAGSSDAKTVRQWIHDHPADFTNGVTRGAEAKNLQVAQVNEDPLMEFTLKTPQNGGQHTLDGFEFAVQHTFGESGFGSGFSYTMVNTDLTYDVASLADQEVLYGVSDTANLSAFYEKFGFSVRATYNWRDKFLYDRFQEGTPNPLFTDAYGQFDLSASYEVMEGLRLSIEGVNILNDSKLNYSRDTLQVKNYTETGARWQFGAAYTF